MLRNQIKESDWKIFKELRPLALDRYCKRVMEDVEKTIHQSNKDSHTRYIEMYKTVKEGDKKLAQMFDGYSRSKAVEQLLLYYSNDLLTDEEFARLSDETREQILSILEIMRG
ncbi:hypothetical protein [Rhodohalobacter sp. 8-1]|uniref:hypothetical protein n=1 Tax=Rhodohalobacter sp. 8-1 TaxID=3131972 RepID=UPI0030EDC4C8